MPGHLIQDQKANEYGSVHAYGENTRCYRDGQAVVCETLNGTAKAFHKDDRPVYAQERAGYWSICRVDAGGAECWHELHGV